MFERAKTFYVWDREATAWPLWSAIILWTQIQKKTWCRKFNVHRCTCRNIALLGLILSDVAATRPLLRANRELERPLQSLIILWVKMASLCLQNTDTYKERFSSSSKGGRKKQKKKCNSTHIHNVLENNSLRSSAVFFSPPQQSCDGNIRRGRQGFLPLHPSQTSPPPRMFTASVHKPQLNIRTNTTLIFKSSTLHPIVKHWSASGNY
jgi:hypothetical protein